MYSFCVICFVNPLAIEMQNALEDLFAIAEHLSNGASDESTSNHQEVDHATTRGSNQLHATDIITIPSASRLDSTPPLLKFDHPQPIVPQNTYYSHVETPPDFRLGSLGVFIFGNNAYLGDTFNLFHFSGVESSDVAKSILSVVRLEK